MASIRALKNRHGEVTSYEITVSLGYDENGQKIRERTTYKPRANTEAKRKKEVEAYAAKFESEVLAGTVYTDGDKIRFREFIEIWDKQYLAPRVKSGDITQRHREDYIGSVKRFGITAIGHMKLNAIKAINIDMLVNDMVDKGYSPKTIRNVFNAIRAMFDYAFRKDIIRENPCARCNPLPKIRRDGEIHFFNEEQVDRFLNDALTKVYDFQMKGSIRKYSKEFGSGKPFEVKSYVEHRTVSLMFRVYFHLAIYGGFRRGELIALKWNDINMEERTIRIDQAISLSAAEGQITKEPKTAAGVRTIKLPQICFDLLREWKIKELETCLSLGSAWKGKRGREFDQNYVFIQKDGTRMNVQTPTAKFREILLNYNERVPEEDRLPLIKLHDLRHTNATHLIANGTDIETVSKRLGHSKPSFTLDVYGHALESKDEQASDTLEAVFTRKA